MKDNTNKNYLILARKWRPQTFDQVVGQRHITATLRKGITSGKIANAYLFSGQRGVGKTSVARIFAKSLNCSKGPTPEPCGVCAQCRSIAAGSDMDVIEIDGATYTRVDDVRELQEGISHLPYAARYKVYIIDEVHMLSTSAFNALLKTLEEPPPRVLFIFATTEPEKIPETIKSRCQIYHFEPIGILELSQHLHAIIQAENITIPQDEYEDVVNAIIQASEGSVRDALVTLEQLAVLGDGEIRLDFCKKLLGIVEQSLLLSILEALRHKKTAELLNIVHQLIQQGRDLERFVRSCLYFLRDLLLIKAGGEDKLVDVSTAQIEKLKPLTNELGYPFLLNTMNTFLKLEEEMKTSSLPRLVLEFHLIKLSTIEPSIDIDTFLSENVKNPRPNLQQTSISSGNSQNSSPDLLSHKQPRADYRISVDSSADYEDKRINDPQKSAPSYTPNSSPTSLKEIWTALCHALGQRFPSLDSALQDCHPVSFSANTFTIGVVKNKSCAFVSSTIQKNQHNLSHALKELTGKSCDIRIIQSESEKPPEPNLSEQLMEPLPGDDSGFQDQEDSSIDDSELLDEHEHEEVKPADKVVLQEIPVSEKTEQTEDLKTILQNHSDIKNAVNSIIDMFDGKIIERKTKK